MGYIFEFSDATSYDEWFKKSKNRYAFDLEVRLLADMLSPASGERLIDIGCGTGKSIEALLDFSSDRLQITGIDPSPYMLDIAKQRLGDGVDLHRGFAEDLPFEDNAFDYALFFTTLEFTDSPAKAIEEACRVARNRVFIVVLNKYAPLNLWTRIKSFFVSTTMSKARFFSIWELKQIVSAILGDVPVYWRTTPQCPWFRGRIALFFEKLFLVQKSPFGIMIGMEVTPVPKFRMRPMTLKIKKVGQYKPATGFASEIKEENYEDSYF
ncbi:MAG: class I SAM-dependent methyltransferase [Thermodesulfobacteriota bacterium]|nr:class I SAM-dependent methyltransferase [Thermodesulfobacteriota bacterium]